MVFTREEIDVISKDRHYIQKNLGRNNIPFIKKGNNINIIFAKRLIELNVLRILQYNHPNGYF